MARCKSTVSTARLVACPHLRSGWFLYLPRTDLRRAGRPAADAQGRCDAPTATLLVGWWASTSARVPLPAVLRLQRAKQCDDSAGAVREVRLPGAPGATPCHDARAKGRLCKEFILCSGSVCTHACQGELLMACSHAAAQGPCVR